MLIIATADRRSGNGVQVGAGERSSRLRVDLPPRASSSDGCRRARGLAPSSRNNVGRYPAWAAGGAPANDRCEITVKYCDLSADRVRISNSRDAIYGDETASDSTDMLSTFCNLTCVGCFHRAASGPRGRYETGEHRVPAPLVDGAR